MEQTTRGGPVERYRWVFAFRVEGDLRFLSHHDTLRLFRRALVRASVPLRYTQGFNPHPCVSLPLPRPVGVASDVEMLLIETEREITPNDVLDRLEVHTPADLHMVGARRLERRERLDPLSVRYRFHPYVPQGSRVDPLDLQTRVQQVLDAETIPVKRTNHKDRSSHLMDIRPYIAELSVVAGTVEFTLRVTNSGTAKPSELVGALGYDTESINHQLRRIDVQWCPRVEAKTCT